MTKDNPWCSNYIPILWNAPRWRVWIVRFMWVVLCKKVPNVLSRCHTKRKTGLHGRTHPSFGMTPTFLFFSFFNFFFFWKVGVIPKEGWAQSRTPVLLLVWQRLRILGTFSCGAAHVCMNMCDSNSRLWHHNLCYSIIMKEVWQECTFLL